MLQKHNYCRELLLIMPIGAMREYEHRELEQQILHFCGTGKPYPKNTLHSWNRLYDYSIKCIVPLDSITEDTGRPCLNLQHLGCYRGVYMRLSHSQFEDVHLLLLKADPSDCWRIQHKFDRPIDILIESGKGMGNWFTDIPLYEHIALGQENRIPFYYMKGKYMSYDGPEGTTTECREYDSLDCGFDTEIRKINRGAFASAFRPKNIFRTFKSNKVF